MLIYLPTIELQELCFDHDLMLSERVNLEYLRRQIRIDGFPTCSDTSHRGYLFATEAQLEGVDSSEHQHAHEQACIGA